MDLNSIFLILATIALLISFYTLYLVNELKKTGVPASEGFTSKPLQLQAYERLVMLAERIALPNLISRANQPGMDARSMQLLLLESIKQEFEYNASQQIYVSPVSWDAVRRLKDQNMHTINSVASTLPAGASGLDLNKRLMEFVLTQKKGELHNIVLEALNFEAKKLMK